MARPQILLALSWLLSISALNGQTQTVGLFLNNTAKVSPGYVLMPALHYGMTYLLDNNGQVVHTWNSGNYEPGRSAYLLPNGHLLRGDSLNNVGPPIGGGDGGQLREYDWDGNVLWTFKYATSTYALHHDFKVLPNGNIIALVDETRTPADMTAAGFRPNMLQAGGNGNIYPDSVVEIQPIYPNEGKIVWEWHVWDHLIQNYDAKQSDYGTPSAHPELIDPNAAYPRQIPAFWNHMNSIEYNADLDQIMLSVRGQSEFWIIDHSTTTAQAAGHTGGRYGKGGDLLYRWGHPMMYAAGTQADEIEFQQHDAAWIPKDYPHAGNVTIFNNGLQRPGGNFTSIDELVLPVDSSGNYPLTAGSAWGPKQLTWTYTANKQYYVPDMGSAQRQPNGNTLICYSTLGLLQEVTYDGEVVWKYVSPVVPGGPLVQGEVPGLDPNKENLDAVFKVLRYWPDYPGLAGRDLTPKGTIEKYPTTFVNGASMAAGSAASGAILSAFGTNLANSTVQVTDSAGKTQSSALLYNSNSQINLVVPDGCASGPARFTVQNAAGTSSWTTMVVNSVAPGLFAANGSGKGAAAINAVRVDANGTQTPISGPINLGAATDQVYVSLFGTGIRGVSSIAGVTATIGGISVPVLSASAQGQFQGLDQVNVGPLHRALAGKGNVNVVLTADGLTANTVTVNIQ